MLSLYLSLKVKKKEKYGENPVSIIVQQFT